MTKGAATRRTVLAGSLLLPASFVFGQAVTSLSARETEILACLAKGQSSKQMAKAMDISVRTVESHRQSIKRKFNLSGQAELVSFAVRRHGQR